MSDLCKLRLTLYRMGLDRGVHEVSGVQGELPLGTTVLRGTQMGVIRGHARRRPTKSEIFRLRLLSSHIAKKKAYAGPVLLIRVTKGRA